MLTLRARGQTLPLWALGISAALALGAGALQYSEILRWQVRAQNAADAAAGAALAAQATAWNRQMAVLYAMSIEEFRIRELVAGMEMAAAGSGGCTPGVGGSCQQIYATLRTQYLAAVNRYTADVGTLHKSTTYGAADAANDARAVVAQLQANCGKPGGGDCAFTYSVIDVSPRPGVLNNVSQDGGAWAVNDGTAATPRADYVPARVEILTCARVAPLVPAFGTFTPPQFVALGRAAATTAVATQEWLEPGRTTNPATGANFQPKELYDGGVAPAGNVAWYDVDFGGNAYKAFVNPPTYAGRIKNAEFSAVTGWWSTIPIAPYSGRVRPSC